MKPTVIILLSLMLCSCVTTQQPASHQPESIAAVPIVKPWIKSADGSTIWILQDGVYKIEWRDACNMKRCRNCIKRNPPIRREYPKP